MTLRQDDGHRRKFSRGVFCVSGETTVEINDTKMEKSWSKKCFFNLVLKMRNVRSRKNNQLTLNNTKHMCGAVFV